MVTRDIAIVAVEAIVDPRPSILVSKEAFPDPMWHKLFYEEKINNVFYFGFLRIGGQARILSFEV